MEPNITVDTLLGTSLMDRLSRSNFHAEEKVAPRLFQAVALLRGNAKRADKLTIGSQQEKHTMNTQQRTDDKKVIVRVARQMSQKPFLKHTVLVRTASNGFLTIGRKQLSANYQLVPTVKNVINISPQSPFYIYLSSFPRKAVRLPKRMAIG